MEALPLREQRQRAYLSTRDLASKAGVSPATIWRIERGDFEALQARTMRAIAEALGVPPTQITEFAASISSTKVNKSAQTGRFVSVKEARRNPSNVLTDARVNYGATIERRFAEGEQDYKELRGEILANPESRVAYDREIERIRAGADNSATEAAMLSEYVLARDWLSPEEDEYWAHL